MGISMENNNKSPYESGLGKVPANFEALSPVPFIERAASVYPNRPAVIYGDLVRSWKDTYTRCCQLADALEKRGIGKGDTIAALLPNLPEMLELHFAAPMVGAVLNAQNIRLDADTIAFMLNHSQANVLMVDAEFASLARAALLQCDHSVLVVDVEDVASGFDEHIGSLTYEQLLQEGDASYQWSLPDDEWQAIALNYTSGTTGNPKGVVYHHRGAYQNALSNILGQNLPSHAVYLWTLPMFHCNGWCYPWSVTAVAGTHVCLRNVRAADIFTALSAYKVTHFCGAPIVLNMMLNAPEAANIVLEQEVTVTTGGAAPPAAIIEGMERLGIKVVHAYGLTETYGPSVFCDFQQAWAELPMEKKAAKMARQGVRAPAVGRLMVANALTLEPLPHDGESMGEVFIRGNTVMKGYLANPQATQEAFQGGWFHTGDLAVCHPDGYIEVKDRAKDIIISGGENISTLEVENTLYQHPDILEAAVVALSDDKWGEVPCAVITLKAGADVSADDLIQFCRARLAHFKCPKQVVFSALPKTSTGKIQKFALRELVKTAQ